MGITSGSYAALPGSHSAGDLYLTTNSFYDWLLSDGVNWLHLIGGFRCLPPASGNFSWVNQGSATVVTSNGGIALRAPGTSGNQHRILKKAIPSAPYNVTSLIIPGLVGANYTWCGMVLRESGTGKLATFGVIYDYPGGGFIAVHSIPSETDSSTVRSVSWTSPLKSITGLFLKINDTGTQHVFSFSGDGQNFIELHSGSYLSLAFTDKADEIGIFANANNASSYDAIATVLHWDEAGSARGRNYGFWGKGAIGSGGPNAGIFGD